MNIAQSIMYESQLQTTLLYGNQALTPKKIAMTFFEGDGTTIVKGSGVPMFRDPFIVKLFPKLELKFRFVVAIYNSLFDEYGAKGYTKVEVKKADLAQTDFAEFEQDQINEIIQEFCNDDGKFNISKVCDELASLAKKETGNTNLRWIPSMMSIVAYSNNKAEKYAKLLKIYQYLNTEKSFNTMGEAINEAFSESGDNDIKIVQQIKNAMHKNYNGKAIPSIENFVRRISPYSAAIIARAFGISRPNYVKAVASNTLIPSPV
jgi:polyhydroxyalkanoate synthesis regulator phasin